MATLMFPYQAEIVPQMCSKSQFLWWDAGCGKTLPLLTAGKTVGGRVLYLGPPVIRTQVAREAVKFGCYADSDIQIILSGKDRVAPQAKLVIASYEHCIQPDIWKQLYALDWEALILDEAHLLKDPAAKRTRAVYGARRDSKGALIRKAKRVWIATGTPVLNDPSDLWTHVSRLFPDVLAHFEISSKNHWIEHFCHTRQTPYGPKILGAKNLDQLKAALKPHVSRVKKTDLPPLQITELWVPAADIRTDDLPAEALEELDKLLKADAVEQFESLAVPLATLRKRIGVAKAVHCIETIINEFWGGVGKTILFYQHKDVAQTIIDYLHSKKIYFEFAHYSGGLTPARRNLVVDEFTKNASCRLLLAQVQAAGVGLNLQCADRVVILEPAWTPAVNEQAISRAWRKGQTRSVWTSFVMLEGSIDERISSCIIRKSRIIERLEG